MNDLKQRLQSTEWHSVRKKIDEHGYDVLPQVLSKNICKSLIGLYDESSLYRKTVSMERFRFGRGEYKYFAYPLPEIVSMMRNDLYTQLVPIANKWMRDLDIDVEYPGTHEAFIDTCRENGQTKPTALILKYEQNGFNTMHQDLYGEVYFPFQIVLFLNEPGEDYSGGEFVLMEQIPRAQSKAIVLAPKRGDVLIFTTNFRPAKGSKGFYRVRMKHGVSEVREGQRHTLGIIFHDAVS